MLDHLCCKHTYKHIYKLFLPLSNLCTLDFSTKTWGDLVKCVYFTMNITNLNYKIENQEEVDRKWKGIDTAIKH